MERVTTLANPVAWRGLRYPDSDLVGLIYRFARPGRDFPEPRPRAVDVACGPGRHVRLLEEVGFDAVGIDNDPQMCETALANGVSAQCVDLRGFDPGKSLALAVCWGITMLIPDLPKIVAGWGARVIIADWRTPDNTCLQWRGNTMLANGAVRLRREGHVLDGQEYFFFEPQACQFPGYQRRHWQKVSRTAPDGEHNVWLQSVHVLEA